MPFSSSHSLLAASLASTMAATAYGFAPMGGLKLGNAPRHTQLASSRRAPVAARSLINTRMAWNRDAGREVRCSAALFGAMARIREPSEEASDAQRMGARNISK